MTEKWEVWVRDPEGAWRRSMTTYSVEHVNLLKESYLQRWSEVRIDHRVSQVFSKGAA